MKQELQRLRSSVEAMTTASVESLVQRLLDYSSRPLSDFNKFDALAMRRRSIILLMIRVIPEIIYIVWPIKLFGRRMISLPHSLEACYSALSVIKIMRRFSILSAK